MTNEMPAPNPVLPVDAEDKQARTKPRGGTGLKIFAAIAMVIALAAASGAVYLYLELEDLKTSTESDDRRLTLVVDDLEKEVGGTSSFGNTLADRVDDLVAEIGGNSTFAGGLADRVDDIEDDIDDLQRDIIRLDGDDYGIIRSVNDLTECVNTYMETVGNSNGGRYRYFFC